MDRNAFPDELLGLLALSSLPEHLKLQNATTSESATSDASESSQLPTKAEIRRGLLQAWQSIAQRADFGAAFAIYKTLSRSPEVYFHAAIALVLIQNMSSRKVLILADFYELPLLAGAWLKEASLRSQVVTHGEFEEWKSEAEDPRLCDAMRDYVFYLDLMVGYASQEDYQTRVDYLLAEVLASIHTRQGLTAPATIKLALKHFAAAEGHFKQLDSSIISFPEEFKARMYSAYAETSEKLGGMLDVIHAQMQSDLDSETDPFLMKSLQSTTIPLVQTQLNQCAQKTIALTTEILTSHSSLSPTIKTRLLVSRSNANYFLLNRDGLAYTDWREILTYSPHDPTSNFHLAEHYYTLQNFVQAYKHYSIYVWLDEELDFHDMTRSHILGLECRLAVADSVLPKKKEALRDGFLMFHEYLLSQSFFHHIQTLDKNGATSSIKINTSGAQVDDRGDFDKDNHINGDGDGDGDGDDEDKNEKSEEAAFLLETKSLYSSLRTQIETVLGKPFGPSLFRRACGSCKKGFTLIDGDTVVRCRGCKKVYCSVQCREWDLKKRNHAADHLKAPALK